MPIQKILLPYNFTRQDGKALDFVIQTYSQVPEAHLTLMNIYTPVPKIETEDRSVMAKMKSNMTYLMTKVREQEDALKATAEEISQMGYFNERLNIIFKPQKKDIASEIIDAAIEGKFRVVVLNRKPGKITRFFTGSTHSKIIPALKGIVVSIVS